MKERVSKVVKKRMMDYSLEKELVTKVIQFYALEGRHDLPWRKNITPYKILISEIMLQQTQVKRVLEKFPLWMKRYPTLASLRKSNLKEVLLLWQGLGYQRRAKALFLLAQETRSLPNEYSKLLRLPGVGKYTASALCAFAYNTFSLPLIETNIRTVLFNFFYKNIDGVSDENLHLDLERLSLYEEVKSLGARDWYYALMDYGAVLKSKKLSKNHKSFHYKKQSTYKGSLRELRAKLLFALAKNEPQPKDERLNVVISQLLEEGFIEKRGIKIVIKD